VLAKVIFISEDCWHIEVDSIQAMVSVKGADEIQFNGSRPERGARRSVLKKGEYVMTIVTESE